MVSRTWRIAATPLLFRSLAIQLDNHLHSLDAFLVLLRSSHSVALCARALKVSSLASFDPRYHDDDDDVASQAVLQPTDIARTLRALPNLDDLTISSCCVADCTDRPVPSRSLKRLILRSIRSAGINIHGGIAAILYHFTSIHVLRLENNILASLTVAPLPPHSALTVRTLAVLIPTPDDTPALLTLLNAFRFLATVTTLELTPASVETVQVAVRFLESDNTALRTVILDLTVLWTGGIRWGVKQQKGACVCVRSLFTTSLSTFYLTEAAEAALISLHAPLTALPALHRLVIRLAPHGLHSHVAFSCIPTLNVTHLTVVAQSYPNLAANVGPVARDEIVRLCETMRPGLRSLAIVHAEPDFIHIAWSRSYNSLWWSRGGDTDIACRLTELRDTGVLWIGRDPSCAECGCGSDCE